MNMQELRGSTNNKQGLPWLLNPHRIEQRTVLHPVLCQGVGLHSGLPVNMWLRPAPPGTGFLFHRTDVRGDSYVPARYDTVSSTLMNSSVRNTSGVLVMTVEHLIAACSACGLDNVLIDLDGPEVPIMDGSAAPFVNLIASAGSRNQGVPRRLIVVNRPVVCGNTEGAYGVLRPSLNGVLSLDATINFDAPSIGYQRARMTLDDPSLLRKACRARTFGFKGEIERLQKEGLALGAGLENAIGVDGEVILNPGGLRFKEEFVYHKLLDCVGDLALAPGSLIASFEAYLPGHTINNSLLHTLFSSPGAWSAVSADVLYAHEEKRVSMS